MAEPAYQPKEIIDAEFTPDNSFLLKAGIITLLCSFVAVGIFKKQTAKNIVEKPQVKAVVEKKAKVAKKPQVKTVAPSTEWIMIAAGRNCVEKEGRYDCVGMTLNLGLRSDGVVVWR